MTPEIIKYTDNDAVYEFFFLAFISKIKDFDYKNPAEVTLIINGKQAPFKDTIESIYERMESSFNEQVEERAKELVKERTSDKIEEIERVLSKVKESVLDVLMDEGFKNVFDDQDYWND